MWLMWKVIFTSRRHEKHINRVHIKQKDHNCDSGGKAFSSAGDLKRHIKTVHNGQKDHKCDSCGKAFSSALDLKRHIYSVHIGQKEHKCDSREKTFSQGGHILMRFIMDKRSQMWLKALSSV